MCELGEINLEKPIASAAQDEAWSENALVPDTELDALSREQRKRDREERNRQWSEQQQRRVPVVTMMMMEKKAPRQEATIIDFKV